MIGFEIVVHVSRGKRQEFLQAWSLLAGGQEQNPACLEQNLFEDAHESNMFLWLERWNDAGQMEAHLKSDRFRMVLGAIEVLGETSRMRRAQWETVC